MPIKSHAVEPHQVADETFVIGQLSMPPGAPVGVYLNSAVIRGSEPVIVDTGTYANRDQWLEDAFSLVDPVDVRWIYLSHDDHDHVGNLEPVLDACPRAKLVSTWFMTERLGADFDLPFERMRWLNDGESFRAGDRTLTAVRPPLFDSPTSRGLFDDSTGFYWAVDCFASVQPNPGVEAADVDRVEWLEGFAINRINSPWHQWLDPKKFGAYVDRVRSLGISAIGSAHGPALHGEMIDEAFRLVREVPYQEAPPLPGQVDLDAMVAAMTEAHTLVA